MMRTKDSLKYPPCGNIQSFGHGGMVSCLVDLTKAWRASRLNRRRKNNMWHADNSRMSHKRKSDTAAVATPQEAAL